MSFFVLVMMLITFIFGGCNKDYKENNTSKDQALTHDKITALPNSPDTMKDEERKPFIEVYDNLSGAGSHRNKGFQWIQITSSGDGKENIVPSTAQTVAYGQTFMFTLTPNEGYRIVPTVGGTCPIGSFLGSAYTTGVLSSNCDVIFTAEPEVFAYVSPALNATSIDKFLVGGDGSLLSYTIANTRSGVQTFGQMTFATVNEVEYAYILDPNGAVYWCSVNIDGTFSNCAYAASLPSFGFWQARGIAFATFNAQYAYIVDPGNNVVYQCALDLAGNFSSCQQSPSPYNLPTLAPYGIAFATDGNGRQQAYIADADSGHGFGDILLCSMHNDGSFNACAETPSSGAPNWIPVAIAFTTVNGTQYAYVADNGTGTPGHVYKCALNNDGSFVNSGCIQTPTNDSLLTDWYPYYIAFQTIDGAKYAYIVNSSGSSIGNIYKCLMDNSGLFTNCVLTPETTPLNWQPSGVAFRQP